VYAELQKKVGVIQGDLGLNWKSKVQRAKFKVGIKKGLSAPFFMIRLVINYDYQFNQFL
jgi:hypothetical protein